MVSKGRTNGRGMCMITTARWQVLIPVHEQHEPIYHMRYRKIFLLAWPGLCTHKEVSL